MNTRETITTRRVISRVCGARNRQTHRSREQDGGGWGGGEDYGETPADGRDGSMQCECFPGSRQVPCSTACRTHVLGASRSCRILVCEARTALLVSVSHGAVQTSRPHGEPRQVDPDMETVPSAAPVALVKIVVEQQVRGLAGRGLHEINGTLPKCFWNPNTARARNTGYERIRLRDPAGHRLGGRGAGAGTEACPPPPVGRRPRARFREGARERPTQRAGTAGRGRGRRPPPGFS